MLPPVSDNLNSLPPYWEFPWSKRMAKRTKIPTLGRPKDTAYRIGETFENPYLGNKILEILDPNAKRVGWLWSTIEGRIIVSPHLGFYVWYNEGGEEWTMETGALWLIQKRYKER